MKQVLTQWNKSLSKRSKRDEKLEAEAYGKTITLIISEERIAAPFGYTVNWDIKILNELIRFNYKYLEINYFCIFSGANNILNNVDNSNKHYGRSERN